MRKCARNEHVINSEEFQAFARPNGDIEKHLQKLPRLTTQAIIERMHQMTDINEKKYDIT